MGRTIGPPAWAAGLRRCATACRPIFATVHADPDPESVPLTSLYAQMALLVKPNGCSEGAYVAAIKPFRYLLVYPALMRRLERDWHAGASQTTTATPV